MDAGPKRAGVGADPSEHWKHSRENVPTRLQHCNLGDLVLCSKQRVPFLLAQSLCCNKTNGCLKKVVLTLMETSRSPQKFPHAGPGPRVQLPGAVSWRQEALSAGAFTCCSRRVPSAAPPLASGAVPQSAGASMSALDGREAESFPSTCQNPAVLLLGGGHPRLCLVAFAGTHADEPVHTDRHQ